MEESQKSWEKFLHPESLKGNLIIASLFISAFEMFKDRVIELPKTFFSAGFDQNGLIISDEYKTEVLTKSKGPLYSSLLWFKEMGSIDENDIEIFDGIRKHRNEVTHELISFISDNNKNIDVSKIHELVKLLEKIEKWWFINFEMAVNPHIVPDDADPHNVIPGAIMSLQLMLDIALGNEPEEGYYYNEFIKKRT